MIGCDGTVKYSGRVAEGIRGNSGKRSTEERSSKEFAFHPLENASK
jgi:hypothetical protein